MREIKFRGKEIKTGQWVYGGGAVERETNGRWHMIGLDSEDRIVIVVLQDGTTGQYTGLKDKNGVEIYEADILRARHDDGGYDTGAVVYGRKGAFCLDLPKVATGIKVPLLNYIHGMMFNESDFEVIGNIMENPELVK